MTPAELTVADDVATLLLVRPERGNALGPDLVEAATAAVREAGDRGVRLLVLRGAGRHFCTGFDLSDLEEMSDGDLLLRLVRIEQLLQAVHHAPMATVGFGTGMTLGAGADLFAACQHRWAAPGTRFAFPGAGFGIALGTRRLARLVGDDATRDLVGSGRRIDADAALALGLATAIVEPDRLGGLVGEEAARLARLDRPTTGRLMTMTRTDTRDRDMADLVESAARPGLTARVAAYIEAVKADAAKGRAT